MQIKTRNNIKQLIVRAMAVMITLSYVLGPVHVQLKNILHTISHNLTIPSQEHQHDIGHSHDSEHILEQNLHNEHSHTIEHNHNKEHSHENVHISSYENESFIGIKISYNQSTHHHKFLDFLETIFSANTNGDSEDDSTLVDFKIKKHIVSYPYSFMVHNDCNIDKSLFGFKDLIFKKEYLDQLYQPPKA